MSKDKERKKTPLNFETVGSIVAMIIGASALFVAWDQAQIMRVQQHASVWPILSVDLVISGDKDTRFIEFVAENAGVGPALVESISLKSNGEDLRTWKDLETALFGAPIKGAMAFNGNDLEGAVLAPGESATALKGVHNAGEEVDAAFQSLAERYLAGGAPQVTLEVCYCSVFDRCWRSQEGARSKPVKECPAPTHLFNGLFADDKADDE